MVDPDSCDRCRFRHGHQCRRNAPMPMSRMGNEQENSLEFVTIGLWPWTHSTDWCGEFEVKRKKIASPPREKVRDRLITGEEFGSRVYRALKSDGVETIGDLAALTQEEILRTPNLGRVNLISIAHKLAHLGIKLEGAAISYVSRAEFDRLDPIKQSEIAAKHKKYVIID
jgi:hypothetical protein